MDDRLKSLVLDMLEWIGPEPRAYTEVIEAWRTSCPRLMVWEEAVEHGFVTCDAVAGRGVLASVTPAGRVFLGENRGHMPMSHLPQPLMSC